MKKILLNAKLLMGVMVMMVVIAACTKEQSPVAEEQAVASEGTVVAKVAGSSWEGAVPASYAAALAANYADKYDEDNATYQVAFKADDLVAYINNLKAKYKSDVIYVNFGVYGKNAPAPVNPKKNNGRLTVFFTGNKIPAPSTGKRSDNTMSAFDAMDEFLNHGSMIP